MIQDFYEYHDYHRVVDCLDFPATEVLPCMGPDLEPLRTQDSRKSLWHSEGTTHPPRLLA